MKSCPKRADFYQKLGDDQAVVASDMKAWLEAFEAIVKRLVDLYQAKGMEK